MNKLKMSVYFPEYIPLEGELDIIKKIETINTLRKTFEGIETNFDFSVEVSDKDVKQIDELNKIGKYNAFQNWFLTDYIKETTSEIFDNKNFQNFKTNPIFQKWMNNLIPQIAKSKKALLEYLIKAHCTLQKIKLNGPRSEDDLMLLYKYNKDETFKKLMDLIKDIGITITKDENFDPVLTSDFRSPVFNEGLKRQLSLQDKNLKIKI